MVSKQLILKEVTLAMEKCGNNYPKAKALKYYNEHKNDFQSEEYLSNSRRIPSPVGVLQQAQADLQEQIIYDGLEKGVLHDYSTNSFVPLGMYLNNIPNWEEECEFIGYDFGDGFIMPVLDYDRVDDDGYTLPQYKDGGARVDLSMPQESEMLSNMIDKSPRVQTDSIVYRYGDLPIDIGVGEHGVIKSFQSTSYNPYVAFEDIAEGGTWIDQYDKGMVRYKQRIFVMKGTRGIVLNKHTGCMDWQSELLLDKGMKYVVLAKDDANLTADILVY